MRTSATAPGAYRGPAARPASGGATRPACGSRASSPRSTAAAIDPAKADRDQALRGMRQQAAGRTRPPEPAGAAHGLRRAAASSRCSAANRSNAARSTTRSSRRARISTGIMARPPAPARQQRRPRRPAPHDPGRARPERLRSAISPICQSAGPGGFFENLFGIGSSRPARTPRCRHLPDALRAHLRRLLFPDLLLDGSGKFADDEKLCQRLCPATEAVLYSHRNPGEDVSRAVSMRAADLTRNCPPPSLSQGSSTPPVAAARRGSPGPTRSSSSTTRRSNAATSSCNRGAGQGALAAARRRARQADQAGKRSGQPHRRIRAARRNRQHSAAKREHRTGPVCSLPAATPAPSPAETAKEDPSKRKVRAVDPTYLPGR